METPAWGFVTNFNDSMTFWGWGDHRALTKNTNLGVCWIRVLHTATLTQATSVTTSTNRVYNDSVRDSVCGVDPVALRISYLDESPQNQWRNR